MTVLLENQIIETDGLCRSPEDAIEPIIQASPPVGLEEFYLGQPMSYRGITMVPLFLSNPEPFRYLSLKQALEQKTIQFEELGEEGVVPEILVNNLGDTPVMLMDGEEVIGLKQNRVFASTVLLRSKAQTSVPVSCVEKQRWAYRDDENIKSINMLEQSIRFQQMKFAHSISGNNSTVNYNQENIWYGIHLLLEKAGTWSHGSALKDVYQQKRIKLNRFCKAFPAQSGQNGMILLRGNIPLGMDVFSNPDVFQQNHCKLVSSYVLDSLLEKPQRAVSSCRASAIAGEFATQANESNLTPRESLGLGATLQVDSSGMIGSVLVCKNIPIHSAFLAKPRSAPDSLLDEDREGIWTCSNMVELFDTENAFPLIREYDYMDPTL